MHQNHPLIIKKNMLAIFLPLFKEVVLTKNIQTTMIEAARKNYPLEACGILFGEIVDNETVIIKDVVETKNSADNPTVRFYIDPEVFYTILTTAEESGLEFLGIFHSHPAQPHPSSWDLEYMKLHQNVWIIIQSHPTEKALNMKAFQWYNDNLFDVGIKMV